MANYAQNFSFRSEYAKKLLDPRWQKKRLEVLEGAGWKCSICGNDKATLHVHHKMYLKGREPWDYDAGQLASMCECCHEEWHEVRGNDDALLRAASFAPMDGPGGRDECSALLSGFLGLPGYENAHPALRAMYEIGRYAETLSHCRGGEYLPSKDARENLLNALSYSHQDVSSWLQSRSPETGEA